MYEALKPSEPYPSHGLSLIISIATVQIKVLPLTESGLTRYITYSITILKSAKPIYKYLREIMRWILLLQVKRTIKEEINTANIPVLHTHTRTKENIYNDVNRTI